MRAVLATSGLVAALAFALAVQAAPGEAPSSSESSTHREVALDVEGIACQGCARRIDEVLARRAGIIAVDVHFPERRVFARFDPKQTSPEAIRAALEEMGFTAKLVPFHVRFAPLRASGTVGTTEEVEIVVAVSDDDAYVHPDAPLKLTLTGEDLELTRPELTRADVVGAVPASNAKTLVFRVPFAGVKAGKQTLKADLSFSYCTPDACLRQKARAQISINVSPASQTPFEG